ncbi:MAG: glycosyl hydrolase family 28-related protein [Longimicrobiaceae bacterium]
MPGPSPVPVQNSTIQGLLLDRGGQVINVKHEQFGAVGDGVTNDAPAINAALDLARMQGEYGQGPDVVVYVPAGIYRLDQPLNMNGGQFELVGAGSYHTVLRGNTGDRAAVVEMVGSTFCKLSHLLIDDMVDTLPLAQRNPSAVGVLLARVDAPVNVNNYAGARFAAQSWHNNLEDVVIRLRTRPGANGGKGTVAYYNFACEVSNWHNCFFLADTGALLSASNQFGVQLKTVHYIEWKPGVPEQMRMWAGESSMTVGRSSGANTVVGMAGPAIRLGGGADFAFDAYLGLEAHLYLPNTPQAWPKYAIVIDGQVHGLAHRGSIEGYLGAVQVLGVQVSGLQLDSYLAIQNMYDAQGAEIDAVPVVMLDKRLVEYPAGSGNFTNVGSNLIDGHLAPVPTADTANVVGRLVDTVTDASHIIQDNLLTLRQLKVRLRNAWSTSVLCGNLATSSLPLGSGQFTSPGTITRGGNFVAATDGVETDTYLRPGAVGALPAAAAQHRGKLVRVEGGAGVADTLHICEKNAAGAYVWRQI